MGITSALVLFAVIWFMVLFITLPLRLKTQGDVGDVTPGTQAGAPAHIDMKRKFRIVTVIAVILWIIIAGIIVSGVISVRDLDWFGRMAPLPE
jgi:predicted secreted protein